MQQGVPVEHERLQVHQAAHLRGQALQAVLAEVQVQQVSEVDEELVGDGVNAGQEGGREKGMRRPTSGACPPAPNVLRPTLAHPSLTGTCYG